MATRKKKTTTPSRRPAARPPITHLVFTSTCGELLQACFYGEAASEADAILLANKSFVVDSDGNAYNDYYGGGRPKLAWVVKIVGTTAPVAETTFTPLAS